MQPDHTPLLSISIVNFNARERLRECLQSLYTRVTILDLEIIVVDNASNDGSAAIVKTEFPLAILIENAVNRGFNRANNQGLARASGKFLLSLNNDTNVPAGSLEKLVEFLQTHPEYGAVGGRLVSPDGSFQWQSRRSFPTPLVALSYFLKLRVLFPKVDLFHRYALTNRNPREGHDVDALSGACFLVRREVYEQTGGMDDVFFMYGDDLDWSYRIRQKGWRIFYCADAPILHYGGQGGAHHVSYSLIYHYYHAMWLFYSRHLKPRYIVLISLLVLIGISIMYLLHTFLYTLRLNKLVSSKK